MKSTDAGNLSRSSRLLLATILRVATVLVSGCATTNFDHATETPVLFERVPSEDAVVSEVRAVRDGDGLAIFGRVKRTADNCCDAARGHVDIAVVWPDGRITDLASVPHSPRNIPKARTRSARFAAKLPYVVPENVPLRITYHSGSEHTSAMRVTDKTLSAHNPATPDGKS